MDRDDLSRAPRRDHRGGHRRSKSHGIVERSGTWHVQTRVRVEDHRIRLRRGTGLPATDDTLADAEALRDRWIGEIRRDAIHGIKPSEAVSVAARDYLKRPRARPLNAFDVAVVQEIDRAFGRRQLDKIADAEWKAMVDVRHEGNQPQTRERWLNAAFAFLNWCMAERGWLKALPKIERMKSKDLRRVTDAVAARRRVADLRPDLVALLIESAPWHFAAQLATIWSTGARVSSILYGCRLCDALLAPGREQITFLETKNGEPVTSALHPWAAGILRTYLERRGRLDDREGPLFLTEKGRPYTDNGKASGGQTKSAWKGTRRRAVRTLLARHLDARRAGDRLGAAAHKADARLVRKVTQHWFRHLLATELLAQGTDPRTVMDQAGWEDIRSLMRYAHTVDQVRRQAIAARPGGSAPGISASRKA